MSLGPFTVSPAAFSAEQGGRIDVEIAFAAAAEGKITASLLLVTDNGEFTAVTLAGRSEVASVSFTNASVPCTSGNTPRDTAAHLGSTYPGERRVANFHFANDTRGSLPYEWVVCHPQPVPQLQFAGAAALIPAAATNVPTHEGQLALAPLDLWPESPFTVTPPAGTLEAGGIIRAAVTYTPSRVGRQEAWIHMRLLTEEGCAAACEDVPRLRLSGVCEPLRARLSPAAVLVPGQLQLGMIMRRTVQIVNSCGTPLSYSFTLPPDPQGGAVCRLSVNPASGSIGVGGNRSVEVVLHPLRPGRLDAVLLCHLPHGPPLPLGVQATVAEPTLAIDTPAVDFACVPCGQQASLVFTITNTSAAATAFSLAALGGAGGKLADIMRDKFTFRPPCGVVDGGGGTVAVEMVYRGSAATEAVRGTVVCHVAGGAELRLALSAASDEPRLAFDACHVDFGAVNAGATEECTATLRNIGHLEARFEWLHDLCLDPAAAAAAPTQGHSSPAAVATALDHASVFTCMPEQGILRPGESMAVTVATNGCVPRGPWRRLLAFAVDGMARPLPLIITGRTLGVNLSYTAVPANAVGSPVALTNRRTEGNDPEGEGVGPAVADHDAGPAAVDFGTLPLRAPVQRSLHIHNHSGSAATLRLAFATFAAPRAAITTAPTMLQPKPPPSARAAATADSPATLRRRQRRPESETAATAMGLAGPRPTTILHATTRKAPVATAAMANGLALTVVPAAAELLPFRGVTVTITATAEMWGRYRDHLVVYVDDEEDRRIPVEADAVGCPLAATIASAAAASSKEAGGTPITPLIRFPACELDGLPLGGVQRLLRFRNMCPRPLRVTWRTYVASPADTRLIDTLLHVKRDGSLGLRTRLHQGEACDTPFATPATSWTVGPQQLQDCEVYFCPVAAGTFDGLAIGTVALDEADERDSFG